MRFIERIYNPPIKKLKNFLQSNSKRLSLDNPRKESAVSRKKTAYNTEFKTKLVLELLKGEKTILKYSDWALGEFYDRLNARGYFQHSILALIADHNAHISGESLIPIHEFRIPGVIIGQGIDLREEKGVGHQVDWAPTLLSAMGIRAVIPAQGVDLLRRQPSRALIVHRGAYAFVRDTYVVLYTQQSAPVIMDHAYMPLPYDEAKVREGLEYIHGAYEIFDRQLHR